jgi:hypothetical protein
LKKGDIFQITVASSFWINNDNNYLNVCDSDNQNSVRIDQNDLIMLVDNSLCLSDKPYVLVYSFSLNKIGFVFSIFLKSYVSLSDIYSL